MFTKYPDDLTPQEKVWCCLMVVGLVAFLFWTAKDYLELPLVLKNPDGVCVEVKSLHDDISCDALPDKYEVEYVDTTYETVKHK